MAQLPTGPAVLILRESFYNWGAGGLAAWAAPPPPRGASRLRR